MRAGRILAAAAALGLGLAACASPGQTPQTVETPAQAPARLERFESEEAFREYLRVTARAARARGYHWAGQPTNPVFLGDSTESVVVTAASVAGSPPPPPPPPPPPSAPPPPPPPGAAVVAPSAEMPAATDAASITNTQERNVDEGDVVKRIGDYFVVLQDGRLFTVAMRQRGQPGLRVVDRENVYRNRTSGVWIDEMLVYGQRILVTGYSYQRNATEISVFALGADGRLAREGVYYLSSSDYYSPENYASRVTGDTLIFYSPMSLSQLDPKGRLQFPLARRLLADGSEEVSEGAPMFGPTDIYRPVQEGLAPVVHTITMCPLGSLAAGDELACRSTAVTGPGPAAFYISAQAAYVWSSPDYLARERFTASAACEDAAGGRTPLGVASTVFEIPLNGDAPGALRTQGLPRNQFSFSAGAEELRVLVEQDCSGHLTLLQVPLAQFSDTPTRAAEEAYTVLPDQAGERSRLENRFTDTHLVYGWRSRYGGTVPTGGQTREVEPLVVVPLAAPTAATEIAPPHEVIRLERVGPNDIVATGYRDARGLQVSVIDLDGPPRLATTLLLAGRFETEGRSHAFNSSVDAGGDGLIGLPTAQRRGSSERQPWESQDSDVSFLTLADGERLDLAGHLRATPNGVDRNYTCEVSCVDWYGNARPIFTDGRVFALTGSELVEGAVVNGALSELRRVNLTRPVE